MSPQPEVNVTLTEQEVRALIEGIQNAEYNIPGGSSAVKKLKLAQAERLIVRSAT